MVYLMLAAVDANFGRSLLLVCGYRAHARPSRSRSHCTATIENNTVVAMEGLRNHPPPGRLGQA